MGPRKKKIHGMLKYGESNSVSRKELERKVGISDRAVRNCISSLRTDGIPVCSNSGTSGYFIADSNDEVDHFLNENHKRAMVLLTINKKVREGYGKAAYDYDLLDLVEE
jgi:biotin operon repressor